jgi:hypothetical protein
MTTVSVHGFMYDSSSATFPAASKLNAYYYNGDYAHRPYTVGPGRVWIDVLGDAPTKCSILQIDGLNETQISAMIGIIPSWLRTRARSGGWQTLYCNRSLLPRVQAAARLTNVDYFIWLSTLDGTVLPALPTKGGTLIGTQSVGAAGLGIHADRTSVTSAAWWAQHAAR